jgi:poly-beta-1,6-N-acetyl-D-glucosamine synthase
MSKTNQDNSVRYVIVSAVRDEASHLEHTIRSMVGQTVRPAEWIIVNDGSTDQTGEIIDRWASEHSWIVAVHRANRGRREPGTGVVEAFYDGYREIKTRDWDYVVKLDGDLGFAPDYFEKCFAEFDADPKLGIGGGVICHDRDGELEVEGNPRFHVRGANKMYRRGCWEDIGGLFRAPGWDTIDEVKANMLGWSTRSFAELKVRHYRFTGAAQGPLGNAIKNGRGSYIAGYHPLFMVVKCAKHIAEWPFFVNAAGLAYGYISGYLRGTPQIDDKRLIDYIRAQQMRRLLFRTSVWQ